MIRIHHTFAETFRKGARDIVKLLKQGADASPANNTSIAPLHTVTQSANKDRVKLLLENGADINATDKAGKTVLTHAAANGHSETWYGQIHQE